MKLLVKQAVLYLSVQHQQERGSPSNSRASGQSVSIVFKQWGGESNHLDNHDTDDASVCDSELMAGWNQVLTKPFFDADSVSVVNKVAVEGGM